MINYNILTYNLKRKILRFSEKISCGLSRPEFKFVSQMIYGILSSQSCHLSKIARALNEDIRLKKVIDRLSRNLLSFKDSENLIEAYVKAVKPQTNKNSILIIDGSDIIKPCSTKMEGLSLVRDGSTGEIGNGYHTLGVAALTQEKKMKFIIRAKKNRDVIYKGEKINILDLAKKFKGKYRMDFKRKNGKNAECKISIIPIRLICRPNDDLNLVVCYGIGEIPMMLITNLKSDDKRLAVAVTKVYLMRWRIEEYFRFKKQQFDFEDLRVRSLQSIRTLDLMLTVAIGYIGIISEKSEERMIIMQVIKESKRIYSIPKFVYYAIADGLFSVFAKCKQCIADMLKKKPKSMQICLFKDDGFGIA